MDAWEFLDRGGNKGTRGGIKISQFRGIVFCAEGIPIENMKPEQRSSLYRALQKHAGPGTDFFRYFGLLESCNAAHENYLLFINSSFSVKTDRNSLEPNVINELLGDTEFTKGLFEFFKKCFNDQSTANNGLSLLNLMRKLGNERSKTQATANEIDLAERRTKTFQAGKIFLSVKPGVTPDMLRPLCGIVHVAPGSGREEDVNRTHAIFALFARQLDTSKLDPATKAFVDQKKTLWLRILSSWQHKGVDTVAYNPLDETGMRVQDEDHTRFQGSTPQLSELEFKVEFPDTPLTKCSNGHVTYNNKGSYAYNHPYSMTDQIVCWSSPLLEEGGDRPGLHRTITIVDVAEYDGEVEYPAADDDPLHKVGFRIGARHGGDGLARIKKGAEVLRDKARRSHKVVEVICLKELIRHTFGNVADVEIAAPKENQTYPSGFRSRTQAAAKSSAGGKRKVSNGASTSGAGPKVKCKMCGEMSSVTKWGCCGEECRTAWRALPDKEKKQKKESA